MRLFYRIITILLAITLFLNYFSANSTLSSAYSEEGINWLDYDSGMKLAKSGDKPIILYFYADWCAWCQVMENTTYKDQLVIARSSEFITIKVNGDFNNELMIEYDVEGYPTTLFLMPDGKVINKIIDYIEPDAYLQEMEDANNEYTQIKSGNSENDISSGFELTSVSIMGIISVIIIVAIIIVLIRDSKKTD